MNRETVNGLMEIYPTARKGFVKVLVDALDIHAKKNHDYNGKSTPEVYSKFETMAKFADVRRKYSRMFHLIAEEEQMKVDEKLEDTAIDLAVYSLLLTEYLIALKENENTLS